MRHLNMAVVGKDVSKSLSPKMHTFIMKNLGVSCSYDTVSVAEADFEKTAPTLIEKYDAFSVTIPYKLAIQSYLKEIKGDAAVFGAVNTVDVKTGYGYNTDGMGFLLMLRNAGVKTEGKTALVIAIDCTGGHHRSVASTRAVAEFIRRKGYAAGENHRDMTRN